MSTNTGLFEAFSTILRACFPARGALTALDLGVMGIASISSLLLVVLGLLSMRGAANDVTEFMTSLPSVSGAVDGDDRRPSRTIAMQEYRALLSRRCLPGLLLVAAGALWLSWTLTRFL